MKKTQSILRLTFLVMGAFLLILSYSVIQLTKGLFVGKALADVPGGTTTSSGSSGSGDSSSGCGNGCDCESGNKYSFL